MEVFRCIPSALYNVITELYQYHAICNLPDAEFPKQCQDMAKAGKRWPKAEKGLDKDDSLYIFETTGVFVAVGPGKYSYSS